MAVECHFPPLIRISHFPPFLLQVKDLVNPPHRTRFHQAHLDLREAVYHSSKNKPLGMSGAQAPPLPPGMDPNSTTFGKPIERESSISKLVNPRKSANQVEEEYEEGRELYKKVPYNQYSLIMSNKNESLNFAKLP